MERHIRELNAQGLTFLLVEHDMHVVMRLCDPVVVLDHGAKIAEGAPVAVQSDPTVLDADRGTRADADAVGCMGWNGAARISCAASTWRSSPEMDHLRSGSQWRRQVHGAADSQRPAAPAQAARSTLDGVEIGGSSPSADPPAQGVVHVPQERSLFPSMTVWENVLMGAYIILGPGRGTTPRRRGERAVPVGARACRRAGRLALRRPAEDRRARPHADAGPAG